MQKQCPNCQAEIPDYLNNCEKWECAIILAKQNGGRVLTPNNLPITCIRHDGLMLECEHGDHPDYKFPVEVEFIGKRIDLPEWDPSYANQIHALIYCDGCIALTLYECNYAIWNLKNGCISSGRYWRQSEWQLTKEFLTKILNSSPKNND